MRRLHPATRSLVACCLLWTGAAVSRAERPSPPRKPEAAAPATRPAKPPRKDEAGFKPIFDGKTFRGWEGNLKWFRIQEGAIVAGSLKQRIGRNEFLCATRKYGDFELRMKVKLVKPGGNAGIQIRSERIPNHHEMRGYQADVGGAWWGKLYDESRRRRVLAGPDKKLQAGLVKRADWNDYRIRCEGPHIQLWLNGKKTVDYVEKDPKVLKTPLARTGLIGLQIHSGAANEAWYKDIRLKELKPAKAKPKAAGNAGVKGNRGARGQVGPSRPADLSTAERIERVWRTQDAMRRGAAGGGPPRRRGRITTRSDAAGGVDGVRSGHYGFHTDSEDKPWWHVDLGKARSLDRMVIYNRCSPGRP